MNKAKTGLKERVFQVFWVWLIVGLFLGAWSLAEGQNKDQIVLIVESSIKIAGGTGPSYEQKAEGEVFLKARPNGKFSGIGIMTVSYSPQVFGPNSKISEVKGQGDFVLKGERKGKNLRFWIEPGSILLKGTLITSSPLGTEKKPYENTFDPSCFAIGKPESNTGVLIELRDGALTEVKHQGQGKTTFSLHGVETWRIGITGEEIDNIRPHIENSRLDQDLPVSVKFKWNLVGEFTVIGKSGNRRYLEGTIFSAKVVPVLQFEHWDLYRCDFTISQNKKDPEDLIGKSIGGKVTGNSVRLQWDYFDYTECVLCTPAKSYLKKGMYRQDFVSREFMNALSKEELPLVDGKVINRRIRDWLRFSITLKKIK